MSVYYSKLKSKKKTSENWEQGSVCDIKTPVEVDVHLDLHNW